MNDHFSATTGEKFEKPKYRYELFFHFGRLADPGGNVGLTDSGISKIRTTPFLFFC
jgi:hypothetical protein